MAENFETPAETQGRYRPLGEAKLVDRGDRGMRLKAGATTVEVTVLAPDLFRVGMFPIERINEYLEDSVDQRACSLVNSA